MKIIIKIGLWLAIVILSYLVYNSVSGKIKFEEQAKYRRDIVIEKLKDIRQAQFAYKNVKDQYSDNFDSLIFFVKNASFPVVLAMGTVPDSLTEEQAVQLGLVTRDTSYISVKDSIFSSSYLVGHLISFSLDSLPYIPNAGGEKFALSAGEIEKGKMLVTVFEVFAKFKFIYHGLDTSNEAIDPEDGLRVGSMTEPSTSGNWGE